MQRSFNDNATDKLRLENAMKGVAQQLAAMAKDPDRKGYKGPCFVKQSTRVAAGGDHDSLLGELMMESIFGAAFAEAITEALNMPSALQQVDWGNVVDLYDEYIDDRSGSNFTLGQKGSINAMFNNRSSLEESTARQAFLQSLPERMKLEGTYASLDRELDKYYAPSAKSAPSMAA